MKRLYFGAIAVLSALCVLTSCSKHKTFEVEGKIENAAGDTLYLERRGHNNIISIDSMILNSDGDFKFVQKSLDFPEFYKIRIKNKNIDFVVDSTETITITGDLNKRTSDFRLAGSSNVQLMQKAAQNLRELQTNIDKLEDSYKKGEIKDAAVEDSIASALKKYKEKMREIIVTDLSSPVGYYILFLRYKGAQILNPSIKDDLAFFRTVATMWDNNYPNSPRNEYLKNYTLKAIANEQKLKQHQKNIKEISEIIPIEDENYFEIKLPNMQGDTISSKSAKGKIAILDFTVYDDINTRARNNALKNLYNKYKGKLDIYQVSFDNDETFWKSVANRLPWTTVRDAKQLDSPLLSKFNIFALPTVFIIGQNGEILKRLQPNEDIDKIISSNIK